MSWPGHLGMAASSRTTASFRIYTSHNELELWETPDNTTEKTNKNNIKRDLYKDYMPGKDPA
jgi:hypothetical protein